MEHRKENMKLNNAKWCVQCNEIFEHNELFHDVGCPSCTNRSNIMPVSNYIGPPSKKRKEATRANRK